MAVIPNRGAMRKCRDAAKYCVFSLFVNAYNVLKVKQIIIFCHVGVPQIFLALKGAVNLKRLKNIDLWYIGPFK